MMSIVQGAMSGYGYGGEMILVVFSFPGSWFVPYSILEEHGNCGIMDTRARGFTA
jgi:hypothetical protein